MKLTKNDRYLVAVSGGPDSVFLVYWLWKQGYRNLVLAHVNYHWRKDSNQDQRIVELLAKNFGLPLEIKTLFAHQQKPKNHNFEAWARNQRYDFFAQLNQKYNFSSVVIGHQANDLIETYFMQKQRHGFVKHFGLSSLTNHHQLVVWRPLLRYKKSQILKWLSENGIDYSFDSTNLDLTLQRNKIRSQLQENEFSAIKQQIANDNKKIRNQNNIVDRYLKTNQKGENLALLPELKNWKLDSLQRLIYQFFENQNFANPLLGHKRQILNEIVKRVLQSDKNFWSLNVGNKTLIKDYDFLRLLAPGAILPLKTEINSKWDFSRLEKFANRDQIIGELNRKIPPFSHVIYTLHPHNIRGVKWQGKSLAEVLGKRRISYAKRLKTGVIYDSKQKKFLDEWAW